MTAEDFAWNMNDTNAKTNPTSIAGMAGDYAALFGEAKATGPYTVEVPFAQFDVTWTANQMNQESISFAVFSKRACDQNGMDWCRENIIGTGPFEVREWIKDDRIVLDAVQSHWDRVPQIKTLRYVAVPEATSRVAMLQTGEADMARVVIKDIRDLRTKGFKTADAHAVRQVPINYAGNFWEEKHALTGEPLNVTLDLTKPWIGDPKDPARMESARKVRWARAVAYDRELISEQIFNGEGKPYYTQMFSPDDPNWQDKWAIPYDPAMAERLLDEAGYPKQSNGVRFEMELFGALDVPEWGELVDAVAGFWTNIGVKTSVVKTNYSVFRPSLVQRTNTTPFSQQCRHDRGAPWDWPRGHQLTSLTRGGFGCGSEIPFVLETLNKTAGELDVQKRIQYNNDLADYLHNWMLASGVVSLPQLVVYNPRSIQSWDMRDCFECEFNSPELIVPASR